MKACTKCLVVKNEEDFGPYKKCKNGRHSQCRACIRIYQRQYKRTPSGSASQKRYQRGQAFKAYQKEYKEKNRQKLYDYHRNRRLKIEYGISQKEYELMWSKQEGLCAICFRKPKRLDVDHNHKTGDIRQLLCNSCNQGLGMFREDCQVLRSAIKYIEKHQPRDGDFYV